MVRCPKCGSCHIRGPRYQGARYPFEDECLVYTCDRCGYYETRRPLDAETPSELVKLIEHLQKPALVGR